MNPLTASGHYSLDDNIADSITWKRTKSNKFNNEAFEMANTSEEASTIDANEEKVRHTNRDLDTIKQGNSKIENHDSATERGKDDNKNSLKAPEKGTIDSEVANTHVKVLILEKSSQTTISRRSRKEDIETISDVTEGSDIEVPKLPEYIKIHRLEPRQTLRTLI